MSMRALVLPIGLLLIGNVQALAVNAPLTVEPRSAQPDEDLFATKPPSVAPAAAPALPTAAAPAEPAEPSLTGNPLWGIPLSRLTATRERPLFSPTRRPPSVITVAQPAPAPIAPPPKPAEPEKPQLYLLGTVAGREKIGLFIDSATKAVLRLKAGENHKGWVLRAVNRRQVELARGLDTAVLDLPAPDMKAAGTPPPAVAAATAMQGNPALLVNTTTATGAPAMPILAGMATPAGATIVVQPTTFTPPPPQVNPFQQAPKGRMP